MKRFLKIFSALHTATYRVTGGRVWNRMYGVPILLLTTRGRKSGKLRTKPLMYRRDGDGFVLVGSNGGAPYQPDWYWNLQGQDAEVQIGSERRRVRAREAEAEERVRLWAEMVALFPKFEEYQKMTTRRIPVVVLEPL
jgi:deazaflavin-dependent oxidoreductase (nitroreductase family)